MPVLPEAERHTIAWGDIHLVIKGAWDTGAQTAVEGYFERLQLGQAPRHGSSLEVLLEATILDWDLEDSQGRKWPLTLANIRRLPPALAMQVRDYYNGQMRDGSPLAAGRPSSTTTT